MYGYTPLDEGLVSRAGDALSMPQVSPQQPTIADLAAQAQAGLAPAPASLPPQVPLDGGMSSMPVGADPGLMGAMAPPPMPDNSAFPLDGGQSSYASQASMPPPAPEPTQSLEGQPRDITGFQRGPVAQLDGVQAPPRNPLAELLAMSTPRFAPGGGGGGNIAALTKQRDAGRASILGSYDQQAQAVGDVAGNEAAKLAEVSRAQAADALAQESQAQLKKAENDRILAQHDAYLAKTDQMMSDLASKKIDPNQIFTGDKAKDFTFALGAILTAGIIGKDGQSMGLGMLKDRMAANLRAQEAEFANARSAIGARNSFYGQLREQFGDKRLADTAYQLAMVTTAETRMKGMLAGYDSKSAIAKGNETLAVLGRDKSTLQTSFSQQALTTAQQAAAAWAAKQQAMIDKARADAIQLYKLGQEDRQIAVAEQNANTAAGKAAGTGKDETQKQAFEYAQQLEKAGIPAALAEIGALKATLPKPGQDIPGMTLSAQARAAAGKMATFGSTVGQRVTLTDEERVTRKNVDKLRLAYKHAVTGSGGSDAEAAKIDEAFMGAGSTAELWDAIAQADAVIHARKSNLEKGAGPAAVVLYESNPSSGAAAPIQSFKPSGQ